MVSPSLGAVVDTRDWEFDAWTLVSKVKVRGLRLIASIFSVAAFAHPVSTPGFDATAVTIPAGSSEIARPVTGLDLLLLRDIHGSRVSPDGKWVAFVLGQAVLSTNSFRSGLFLVSTLPGTKPKSLGSAGPPNWDDINQWLPESPEWSPDSKYVYLRVKTGDTQQVWRWSRRNGSKVRVSHLRGSVLSFAVGSNHLLMTVAKPRQVLAPPNTDRGILFDGSIGSYTPAPFLEQIQQAVDQESAARTEVWTHDLRTGREQKADQTFLNSMKVPKGMPLDALFSRSEILEQHISSAVVSPDGSKILYQRWIDDPSEADYLSYPLFVKARGTGNPIALTPDIYYAAEFWWSADSKNIFFTQYDAEDPKDDLPSKIMVVAATGGKPQLVSASAGLLYNCSTSSRERAFVCTHQNYRIPEELVLVDQASGELRTLVDVNPEFQHLRVQHTTRIDVSTAGREHLWGHLVLPLNYEPGKRYPLIVTTYRDGDGFLRGAIGDEYPIHVFAASGFGVLNVDVGRTRNFKPGDFESAIRMWQGPIDGLDLALRKAAELGADLERVGISGLSHGAEIVEYAITHTMSFTAAVESGPAARDPLFFYTAGKSWRAIFANWGLEGWPEGKSLEKWRRLSPALNADRAHGALLINAPESEYESALQFLISLQQLGKPVEMFVYPSELHIKNQPKHRYEIYGRNVDWFRFWLQGYEDADPVKTAQYRRWEKLCDLQRTANPDKLAFCVETKH